MEAGDGLANDSDRAAGDEWNGQVETVEGRDSLRGVAKGLMEGAGREGTRSSQEDVTDESATSSIIVAESVLTEERRYQQMTVWPLFAAVARGGLDSHLILLLPIVSKWQAVYGRWRPMTWTDRGGISDGGKAHVDSAPS